MMPEIEIPEELYEILMRECEERGASMDELISELIIKFDRCFKPT